jgi:hypothetical protein
LIDREKPLVTAVCHSKWHVYGTTVSQANEISVTARHL